MPSYLSQEFGDIDSETISVGGAFYSVSSNISVEGTIFDGNSAELFGAAITVENSNISFTQCHFMNNKAGNNTAVYPTGFGMIFSYGSYLFVDGSKFTDNNVAVGGALFVYYSILYITNSSFYNNIATQYGGVIGAKLSSCHIVNSSFSNNSVFQYGGVIAAWLSTFSFSNSSFTSNGAINIGDFTNNNIAQYGGIMRSSFHITNSTFADNSAGSYGGVMASWTSSFMIFHNTFTNNSAGSFGGVMASFGSSVEVAVSTFVNNNAASYGGVLFTQSNSSIDVINSTFIDNTATRHGGAVYSRVSFFNITGSTFINNSACEDGGVMAVSSSTFNIVVNNSFANNSAGKYGGVIQADRSSFFNITSSAFYDNNAQYGGVISMFNSSLIVDHSRFSYNSAQLYGGIMCTFQGSSWILSSIFDHNSGSLYIFNSYLCFFGFTSFENCTEPPNKGPIGDILIYQEGGAITSFLSYIYFMERANLLNNKARNGGAMLATESAIIIYDDSEVILAYNRAINGSGGGISLYQSSLSVYIYGNCSISHSFAVQGRGIHASSSFITVYQQGYLELINNTAENGGGIYLEKNSELYLVKYSEPTDKAENSMAFSANNATYGGAVFVADDTITGSCLPMVECFFQTLAIYLQSLLGRDLNTVNIIFSKNIAEYGSSLYGGLLDRCIPSPLAEVYHKHSIIKSGIAYLGNISNITLDTVSSPPVRVCYCNSEGQPDCEYQLPTIRVKRGETFTMSLVAVDQVNHSIGASIIASTDGGLGEGQQNQEVERTCTDLMFNVFSSADLETVTLFADGPCGNSPLSMRQIDIQFLNCTCPIGFEPSSRKTITCECNCDSKIFPYITTGNATINSLLRMKTNSWISYTNDTHPPGYIIYPFCPVGYCHPPNINVQLNLNIPDGADAQCAYNRTGVLCYVIATYEFLEDKIHYLSIF